LNFKRRKITIRSKTASLPAAILRYGNRERICPAKVDTGSEVCLFARTLADSLEIDVESGYREKFSTLGGGIFAYAHQVELETLGLRFQSNVYFAESYALTRSLLGRRGWLQLITLGLNDYKSELYLSPNEE
jgi:hypothetical protein